LFSPRHSRGPDFPTSFSGTRNVALPLVRNESELIEPFSDRAIGQLRPLGVSVGGRPTRDQRKVEEGVTRLPPTRAHLTTCGYTDRSQ
jgi:hypothetical protein